MSADADTVTLSRAEYEALLDRLENAEDKGALDNLQARIAQLGFAEATKDYLPLELTKRLLDGEHPIRVWRAHRRLTREALAAKAGVSPTYLTEIETRRKPGSFKAISKIATALAVSLDEIASWLKASGRAQ
jgi:DNA-binding XRE family transcriptional regulator